MAVVAAVQMVSSDKLEENLANARQLVSAAAAVGAKLIVLPENFALFSAPLMLQLGQGETSAEGRVRKFLSTLAKDFSVWIVGGSIPVASDVPATNNPNNKVYACCFVFDEQGIERACYRKIHLFDVDVNDVQGQYRESDSITPGDEVVVIDTPFGRLGVAICYDLRFPELFRVMFQRGVDLIAIPAAFTQVTGAAHWLALLRARAIENFCTLIGANQGGVHNPKRETFGHSVIINCWGEVVAEIDKGQGFIYFDVDEKQQQQIRQQIPIKSHQRLFVED